MPGSNQEIVRSTLVDLTLEAVALCNTGANSRAHIVLNKRKENESMPITFEELLKSLKPEHASVIGEHITALTATNEGVVKGLKGQVDELKKAQPAAPAAPAAPAQPTPDPVIKDLPEEVQKKFNAMQATIEAMVSKQADDLAQARFEKCKALPVEEAELKSVLKAASPAVVAILEKAAQALIEKTHSPAGTDVGGQFQQTDPNASYEKLDKAAHKLMEDSPALTFEQAFTKAIELNPAVYTMYAEGVK